jgi:hypothetical protein
MIGAPALGDHRPGNQPVMTPKSLHIRRLTQAPTLPPVTSSDKKEDGATKILDQEQMARAVEITAMTSALWWRQYSIHGVEPGTWSQFWAMEAGDEESEEEAMEVDSPSMPVLIQEAMQAGFSIDQLRQAEEDLASLASSAKVKSSSNPSLSG